MAGFENFGTFFVTMAKVLGFLKWRMLGPHGTCISRLQKAECQGQKVILLAHTLDSERKSFLYAQLKPEQQQRNLDSFAQVWL
jgi:hypothetical protein